MPRIRNEDFVCFVHGHGAKYSSSEGNKPKDVLQRPVCANALKLARERAAAQLAFQRGARKRPEQE